MSSLQEPYYDLRDQNLIYTPEYDKTTHGIKFKALPKHRKKQGWLKETLEDISQCRNDILDNKSTNPKQKLESLNELEKFTKKLKIRVCPKRKKGLWSKLLFPVKQIWSNTFGSISKVQKEIKEIASMKDKIELDKMRSHSKEYGCHYLRKRPNFFFLNDLPKEAQYLIYPESNSKRTFRIHFVEREPGVINCTPCYIPCSDIIRFIPGEGFKFDQETFKSFEDLNDHILDKRKGEVR